MIDNKVILVELRLKRSFGKEGTYKLINVDNIEDVIRSAEKSINLSGNKTEFENMRCNVKNQKYLAHVLN